MASAPRTCVARTKSRRDCATRRTRRSNSTAASARKTRCPRTINILAAAYAQGSLEPETTKRLAQLGYAFLPDAGESCMTDIVVGVRRSRGREAPHAPRDACMRARGIRLRADGVLCADEMRSQRRRHRGLRAVTATARPQNDQPTFRLYSAEKRRSSGPAAANEAPACVLIVKPPANIHL